MNHTQRNTQTNTSEYKQHKHKQTQANRQTQTQTTKQTNRRVPIDGGNHGHIELADGEEAGVKVAHDADVLVWALGVHSGLQELEVAPSTERVACTGQNGGTHIAVLLQVLDHAEKLVAHGLCQKRTAIQATTTEGGRRQRVRVSARASLHRQRITDKASCTPSRPLWLLHSWLNLTSEGVEALWVVQGDGRNAIGHTAQHQRLSTSGGGVVGGPQLARLRVAAQRCDGDTSAAASRTDSSQRAHGSKIQGGRRGVAGEGGRD